MSEPIFSADYWRDRLAVAVDREKVHHAIYECDGELWNRIRERHRHLLRDNVQLQDSILDVGCGWGRLLSMLPESWHGEYLGVDISPDFVAMAKKAHPDKLFWCGDVREADFMTERYDWAVCVSVKQMVVGNAGRAEWLKIEGVLKRLAQRVMVLEYSEDDKGEILEGGT